MNIFILDLDFETNVKYYNDKHVVKMITEHNQLLSTAHWMTGSEGPYKKTHVNHPCAIWTRNSLDNYVWLCWLNIYLCREYTHRYGKIHKGEGVLKTLTSKFPDIPVIGVTPFQLCMPNQYKTDDVVEAYKKFYIAEKRFYTYKRKLKPSTWTKRECPEWCHD